MDDDEAILEMAKEALNYENFHVKTINTSKNAIHEILEYKPDVILLDYLVGEINGGEICHQIKVNPLTKHTPVIIMSGFPRVFESLGNYGCDFFISKPFDLYHLLKTIDACLVKATA